MICRQQQLHQCTGIPLIPRKLYKIGEVMRYTGLTRQTIHNYTVFGLITEAERTESGHRLYNEKVFSRIERIKKLKEKGKSLREIIRILNG
ncbi:MAG: MerR family transcriptional regulator [Planctomycetota bacterium]|nr:MerR family transcriptional regulator [Planctomycetota bacterium]